MLNILSLLAIILLIGAGPAFHLRKALKISNVFRFILFGLILGLIVLNFTVLTIGHFGFSVSGNNLKLILLLLIKFSILIFLYQYLIKRTRFKFLDLFRKWIYWRINLPDLIFAFVFGFFFIYVCLINTRYYITSWDHFSYWLLDPKMIYKTGYLRDAVVHENLFNIITRSSYYPIHAVYVYNFVGSIKEQYTTFFTILYAFLGTSVCYVFSKRFNTFSQYYVIAVLLIINNIFLFRVYLMISFYAELITAFHIVFFFFILFTDFKTRQYHYRIFLLGINLFIFGFIKVGYYHYTILLGLIWFLHDIKFVYSHCRKIINNYRIYLLLIVLALIFIAREYYLHYILNIQVHESTANLNSLNYFLSHSFNQYYGYLTMITDYLIKNYHIIIFILLLGTILQLFTRNHKKWAYYTVFVCLFLFMIPVIEYLLELRIFKSKSLLRYMTLPFYLIPWLFILPSIKIKYSNISKIIYAIIFVIFVFMVFLGITKKYPLNKYPVHNGSFSECAWQKKHFEISKQIKATIHNKTIMIYDSCCGNKVGNLGVPAIYVRYYLAENYVGGQRKFPLTKIKKSIKDFQPDYILINSNRTNKQLRKIFNLPVNNKTTLIKMINYDPLEFELINLRNN